MASHVTTSNIKPVVLIRMHEMNKPVEYMYNLLKKELPYPIVLVADHTKNSGHIPSEFQSISVTIDKLNELNLSIFDKVMYYCGDYALYVARKELPKFTHYWMIEPDVYINFPSAKDFFCLLDQYSEVDFIAGRYTKANCGWWWHAKASPYFDTVYQCIFPLVRLSAPALDYLVGARTLLSKEIEKRSEHSERSVWPNDESFTASALTKTGFICKNFNDFGKRIYTIESYNFTHPHSFNYIKCKGYDNLLYHPVLMGHHFVHKLQTLLGAAKHHGKLEGFASSFQKNLCKGLLLEVGPESVEKFVAKLNEALREAGMDSLYLEAN